MKDQSDLLIEQLLIRFDHKPRRCKKINDSGIGTSERIVCISNDTFFYYPKIQEFSDRDFDKLKYAVPKAGVKLSQILQLKFPPRQKNERNYFSITLPRNKILKYTKTMKQLIVDETAEGYQTWTFIFEYDILSLPELQQRASQKQQSQHRKIRQLKKQQEQYLMKKQQQRKKKIQQQQRSLMEAQKAMLLGQQNIENNQYQRTRQQKQRKEQLERRIRQYDQFYFMEVYEKGYGEFRSIKEQIQFQLDLLETVGKFTKRAQKVVRKYIDQLPFNPNPIIGSQFTFENLFLNISDSKALNHQFLENCTTAHHMYLIRNTIRPNFRIPLYCFIKYKGFKIIVRAITPVDQYKGKTLEDRTLHGKSQQLWKNHFLLSDELTQILESMNLKPYITEVSFQKATVHFGKQLKVIESKDDPFHILKKLDPERFQNISASKITYNISLKQVFPIDLDFQNNINQIYIRLRPQYVATLTDQTNKKQPITAGALTDQYQDEQGVKHDYLVAKASQNLKFKTIFQFVNDLDELKYIIADSHHLGVLLKDKGINIRYINTIFKLTKLPYIRQMVIIEAIARQIKKIYRDHQKQFVSQYFRQTYKEKIAQISKIQNVKSLQDLKKRQLRNKQSQQSISNAIDYLNLIFGNSHQTEAFWEIIKRKVKDYFQIQGYNYLDLTHGYLLKTILYHCGFQIKLSSSLILFASPDPFSIKDWVKFTIKCQYMNFPCMEVYNRTKIHKQMSNQQIISRLQLLLYLKRIFSQDQSYILSKLAIYFPNIQIPGSKYSIENLLYNIQTPAKQKFETTYQIASFILPPNHPFFQQLYLQYASISDFQPITLKKAAENHAIRSLGITHWRTSQILAGFKEQSYLKHLIAAQNGVEYKLTIKLYRKIIQEQRQLGKIYDSFLYTKKLLNFVANRKQKLIPEQVQEYYKAIKIGMLATYQLRKIQDMLRISQYFWRILEEYSFNDPCLQDLQFLYDYSFKAYLQSSQKKYYLFKLALIFSDRFEKQKPRQTKQELLEQLRMCSRQSKTHINFIKQMLTKLEFGYTQINFQPDFFSHFWQHVNRLGSQQLDEGLYEISLFLRIYGLGFFEEALLNKTYTFDKGKNWDIPKIQNNSI